MNWHKIIPKQILVQCLRIMKFQEKFYKIRENILKILKNCWWYFIKNMKICLENDESFLKIF